MADILNHTLFSAAGQPCGKLARVVCISEYYMYFQHVTQQFCNKPAISVPLRSKQDSQGNYWNKSTLAPEIRAPQSPEDRTSY